MYVQPVFRHSQGGVDCSCTRSAAVILHVRDGYGFTEGAGYSPLMALRPPAMRLLPSARSGRPRSLPYCQQREVGKAPPINSMPAQMPAPRRIMRKRTNLRGQWHSRIAADVGVGVQPIAGGSGCSSGQSSVVILQIELTPFGVTYWRASEGCSHRCNADLKSQRHIRALHTTCVVCGLVCGMPRRSVRYQNTLSCCVRKSGGDVPGSSLVGPSHPTKTSQQQEKHPCVYSFCRLYHNVKER
jgi:hypothetical protein